MYHAGEGSYESSPFSALIARFLREQTLLTKKQWKVNGKWRVI